LPTNFSRLADDLSRERFGSRANPSHVDCEFHPLQKRPQHEANKKAAQTAADSFRMIFV
jgi:hypothetical protein